MWDCFCHTLPFIPSFQTLSFMSSCLKVVFLFFLLPVNQCWRLTGGFLALYENTGHMTEPYRCFLRPPEIRPLPSPPCTTCRFPPSPRLHLWIRAILSSFHPVLAPRERRCRWRVIFSTHDPPGSCVNGIPSVRHTEERRCGARRWLARVPESSTAPFTIYGHGPALSSTRPK